MTNNKPTNTQPVTSGREVMLRRTWPQRVVMVVCVAVIVSALAFSYLISTTYSIASGVTRILGEVPEHTYFRSGAHSTDPIGESGSGIEDPNDRAGVLIPDTPAGGPVNFLLVGTDSALGLDPDDPVLHGRYVDPNGRSRADAIMLVRLDPGSGSVWVLSIPRDLWVDIPKAQQNRITSTLWIGGPDGGGPLLAETISLNFGVEINHYIQVDFAGFQAVVDALGGVPVWFPYPARDLGSRLNISTAGCHVLDGRQALQYVRGRHYTERIKGQWRTTGGNDLRRIERQQDFLALALDRILAEGARNPYTMKKLLESFVPAVTLDANLTPAELISLGETFTDFKPENLYRKRLEVYTVRWSDGGYKGEAAYVRKNQAVLDVMRGIADEVRSSPEQLQLIGASSYALDNAADNLTEQGFVILGSERSEESIPFTVVMHEPGHVGEAITVARYIKPAPYVVASEDVEGVVAVLGDDYQGVRFSSYPSFSDIKAQIDAGVVPAVLPNLGTDARTTDTTESATTTSSKVTQLTTTEHLAVPSVKIVTSTTTVPPTTTTEPVVIAGRPPEGVSCG